MYCRKCGSTINEKAKFCDSCGEEVKILRQRSDTQKFEEMNKNKTKKVKKDKREEKYKDLKNPYIIPALGTAVIAFSLAIFPWPVSWGVGTSLWMRIAIVLIVLLSDYHCTKARQMNNLYSIQYNYLVQPQLLKVATTLSVITTIVAMFALFSV